jgi:hypothetical protein
MAASIGGTKCPPLERLVPVLVADHIHTNLKFINFAWKKFNLPAKLALFLNKVGILNQ